MDKGLNNIENIVNNYSPHGLTTSEVKKRQKQFGENVFSRAKAKGLQIFCKQFLNPLSFILIFAAVLAFLMKEYTDGVIIMSIVLINSFLSFIQEYRSNKAVEKLTKLIKQQALVIRNGKQVLIDVKNIVPGDVIILRSGDVAPADVKIIEANSLSVNESHLTGESIPVYKDNNDVLYSGSVIEMGHSECLVYATGNNTVLGNLAMLTKDTPKTTPYQKSLMEFSLSMLKIIGITIILMLVVKTYLTGMHEFPNNLLFAVALAMTVVPEALPMITTINFSNGALQLAKQKVIVKSLPAVEDLGRINILCTDKTGTLTQNRLTVTDIISDEADFFQKLAYLAIEDPKNKHHASSYDRAFDDYIPDNIKKSVRHFKPLKYIPFDPRARRRRVIIEDTKTKKVYLVVIGAAEIILEIADIRKIGEYKKLIAVHGEQGIRQLAIAYKEIKYNDGWNILKNEKKLKFLGFANLIDPLRKTAKDTIRKAKELGIDIKIITGDSIEVAHYIGREIELLKDTDKVYSGSEIDTMTNAQMKKCVNECAVFARINPEQKFKIIKCLQLNNAVGFLGDGVNDMPALHAADVGIAVADATDVAKDSADIILAQDNLEVIINGILYGRSIFVNINKYISHAMIGNIGNFFSLALFYVIFATHLPMLPIQLLIANLMQDIPLMTVYSDSIDPEEIKKPKSNEGIKSLIKNSLYLGIFTAMFYFIFFIFIGQSANSLTRTNLFLFFNLTQMLIILAIRNKQFLWEGSEPSKLLSGTILLFIFISVIMTYIPFTANLMGFVPISAFNLFLLIIVALCYIFMLDILNIFIYRKKQD